MPAMTGANTDAERMTFIQTEIEKAILPYRENTEAVLVVGALMRVARILLGLYKPDLRQGFISACSAYLQGKQTLGEDSNESALKKLGFYLPPGSRH